MKSEIRRTAKLWLGRTAGAAVPTWFLLRTNHFQRVLPRDGSGVVAVFTSMCRCWATLISGG